MPHTHSYNNFRSHGNTVFSSALNLLVILGLEDIKQGHERKLMHLRANSTKNQTFWKFSGKSKKN